MRSNRLRTALNASCAFAMLFIALPALAQESAQADDTQDDAESGSAIAEIVVTARRREESLQTVPVAVTAVTGDMLTERNVQSTLDLQKIVPGVVFSGAATDANTTLTIRGQGRDTIGPGLPSVIAYFNEVPLPGFGSAIPTYDISSVQVLKGPQGTLFGRNTTGGALLVYSQVPTDKFEGYGQATIGDYGWHGVQGALNLPITAGVALRVAGNVERRDGFTENLGVGQDFDTLHNNSFRVSLRLQPTDSIENIFVYDYFDRSGPYGGVIPTQIASSNPPYRNGSNFAAVVGAANAALIDSSFNCNVSVDCDVDLMVARQLQIGPRKVYSDVDAFDNTRLQGISNTTTIDLGPVKIKNIFGWRSTDVDQRGNTDGVPVPLLNTALTRHEAQISNELQFAGSAFNDQLDILVGGFYVKTRPTGSISLFADFLRPPSIPVANWRLSTVGNTLYREESKAVFANLTYDFSDRLEGLSVTAAARYTWDSQGVCSVTLGGASTPLQSTAECRTYANKFDIDAKFEKLTWTFGADYKINSNLFTYIVARRGYRSGGSNPPLLGGLLVSLQFYQPQTVDDVEIGLKTNWRSGDFSGRVNIAAYRGIFNDLQRQVGGIPANLDGDNNSSNDPASTSLIINGAKAKVQGVEIDGFIQPARGFQFTFGGSLIDATFLEFANPPILSGVAAGSGFFQNTPKTSFNLGARAELANIDGMKITLSGDYYWTDGYRKGIVAVLPSYDLANLRVEIADIAKQDLTVTLFVDNLFDKEYFLNNSLSGASPGTTTFSYGPPRMFGVRARFGFGS